ncbi:hypothetical protein [Nodularia sp. NIES-3585]|uniref:hypothetical protein n=1 Tax=Nodularia sp. NIES-3585 TaxID=1973477 RepID=UPI000B6B8E28|nr:hypothetical protein [Nodularia sp. NIES-3585]GAX38804.1 hypothetical protein NIES3585_48560 [Nodularia sp. NIES-3585]
MSNIATYPHQMFPDKMPDNKERTKLIANRLNPKADEIKQWLESPQIKQWLTKLMLGIPNNLKMEAVNTIIKNIIENPDKDCRVQFGSSTIGVDVLRWQLWAAYQLPYANKLKTPDCPYTLKKHLETIATKKIN